MDDEGNNNINKDQCFSTQEAIFRGDFEWAKTLLKLGSDPNHVNDEGETPLFAAVFMNCDDIVDLLLEAGADTNRTYVEGQTVLYWALGNTNLPIVRALLGAGINPSQIDDQHENSLHWIAEEEREEEEEEEERSKIIDELLEAGADINQVDNSGRTPFECTVYFGDRIAAERLLKAGSNPNRFVDGQSTLYMPAFGHFPEIADLLLEAGVDFNQLDQKGETPLFHAAAGGKMETVKKLLKLGAKVDHMNNDGETASVVAGKYEAFDTAEVLERWPRINTLQMLCWRVVHFSLKKSDIPAWVPRATLKRNFAWELLPPLKKGKKRKGEEKNKTSKR